MFKAKWYEGELGDEKKSMDSWPRKYTIQVEFIHLTNIFLSPYYIPALVEHIISVS